MFESSTDPATTFAPIDEHEVSFVEEAKTSEAPDVTNANDFASEPTLDSSTVSNLDAVVAKNDADESPATTVNPIPVPTMTSTSAPAKKPSKKKKINTNHHPFSNTVTVIIVIVGILSVTLIVSAIILSIYVNRRKRLEIHSSSTYVFDTRE